MDITSGEYYAANLWQHEYHMGHIVKQITACSQDVLAMKRAHF